MGTITFLRPPDLPADATRDLARERWKRAQQLLERDASSRDQSDVARAEFEIAKARVELAKLELERTQIRAPFDGVVGLRLVDLGTRVDDETQLVRIDSVDRLQVSFAISELGISFTWMKEPEELMQLAKMAFEIGEARFAERDVRYGNLASSISHFKETMLYLETIEPKPSLFKEASDAYEAAVLEQGIRYEDYMFRADRAIRLKDREEAAKYLRILIELVQDRSDPRYEKISVKLLNIEQHLK